MDPASPTENRQTASGGGHRHLVAVVVALAATIAIGWLLYARWRESGFQWSVFASSFARLSWGWIAASYILTLATYWGRVLRWAVMIRPLRPKPSLWGLLSATAIGFTAVILLGRPGEIVRPYLIAAREKVSLSSQFAIWFLERICDLLAVCLIFGFALTQVSSARTGIGAGLRWVLEAGGIVLGLAGAVCVVILLLLRHHSETIQTRILDALAFLPARRREIVERIVTTFVKGTASTKDGRAALLLALYTALEWGLIAVGYVCFFQAYHLDLSVRDVLVFLGFVCFGSLVNIPGIGGGIQIVSVVVLTEIYRIPLELASSLAVTIWIITFVGIAPFGLLLAFHEGLNWRKLKNLKKEAALESGPDPVP